VQPAAAGKPHGQARLQNRNTAPQQFSGLQRGQVLKHSFRAYTRPTTEDPLEMLGTDADPRGDETERGLSVMFVRDELDRFLDDFKIVQIVFHFAGVETDRLLMSLESWRLP
jgi:hypothetical protein